MFLTRNSKRLAEKQNTDSTAKSKISKCEGAPMNKNAQEGKRNLNRACKQTLQRDILKENKVCDETCAKKVLKKSNTKSSVRLVDNKLKNNESENITRAVNSKKNLKVDKENNWSKNQTPLTVPLKELYKTKTGTTRKITNYFPLKTISDNAISRVPIWAVSRNPPQKQTKKRFRVSDIYNIEKDEDLMNESPVKKRKKPAAKKCKTIKNKVFSKKNIWSHNSHKDKFLSAKSAKPVEQFTECEGLTVNSDETERSKINLNKPIQHPVETAKTISVLEDIYPIPEPVDSVLESLSFKAVKDTEIPVAVKETVTGNNVEKGEGYVEDCINDCYSSFANIDTSYISLRHSVAKCLGELSNHNNMSPEKHQTLGQDKISNCVEDCINECYSSFINLDTSLRESVEKNKAKLMRCDKTPEKSLSIGKTNSKVCKKSNNYCDEQIFLIPKMTSTPENVDHPIIQPVKQLSKNCGLKLSEMSAIPFTVSHNIQFELSEYEISPIKPVSPINQETSFFGSSSKSNKNSENEVCLSGKTTGTSNLKEMTTKVQGKNPTVRCKIPKISEKSACIKTKDNEEDTEALSQKENIENAVLCNPRHNRKGPMSPLKPIQLHKESRNVKINLFESPGKAEMTTEKSPVKKARENISTEETASSSLVYDDLIFDYLVKVTKPTKVYQSPFQSKKFKSRTKIARPLDKHGKTKDPDYRPKKQVSRTKKIDGEKWKAKEENERVQNKNEAEKLNQHFLDMEQMDLCIE